MTITCTDCGARIDLPLKERRRLAGKFFACPECGASRKLPPATEDASILRPGSRRALWRSLLPTLVAILPLVGLLIWYWSSRSDSKPNGKDGDNRIAVVAKPSITPGVFSKDKHLDVVRSWLRENTNSGQWEEVRWWPVRDVKTRLDGVVHAGRLKYRTEAGIGKRLIDDVFVFDDNVRLKWSHASKTSRTDDGFTAATVTDIVEEIDAEDERTTK